MTLEKFLEQDREKLEKIINDYPKQIPADVIAEFFGCKPNGVRKSIQESYILGISWQLDGKSMRSNCIPTGKFIRWYLALPEMRIL